MSSQKIFGLIGKNISYSFSKKYFTEKFSNSNSLGYTYENFDIEDIDVLKIFLQENKNLSGLNVTIPYKTAIIPFLDKLSTSAKKIGAVNVIRFTKKGNLKGYNSDYYGFKKSLEPLLQSHHQSALVLGTGGASKAIAFALSELNIKVTFVTRTATDFSILYEGIDEKIIQNHTIIINCTPLGTSPNIHDFPKIPYQFLTDKHIAFDLIYNPEETEFLKKAKQNGAICKNGYEMLVFQAEKAWDIWQK